MSLDQLASASFLPGSFSAAKPYLARAKELDASKMSHKVLLVRACLKMVANKCQTSLSNEGRADFAPGEGEFFSELQSIMMGLKGEIDESYKGADMERIDGSTRRLLLQLSTNVYGVANKEFEAGKLNTNILRTFSSARTYFEILKYFHSLVNEELDADSAAKYEDCDAKVKAIKIHLVALKRKKEEDAKKKEAEEEEGSPAPANYFDDDDDFLPAVPKGGASASAPKPIVKVVKPEDNQPDVERAESFAESVNVQFGDLPRNAQLSVRGRQFLRQGSLAVPEKKTSDILEAEGYARNAVDQIKANLPSGCAEAIAKALNILEKRKPKVSSKRMQVRESTKFDVVEYLLFAARALEAAGQFMTVSEAKSKAAGHLSDALDAIHADNE